MIYNPKIIMHAVGHMFGLTKEEIASSCRRQEFVEARVVIIKILREELKMSWRSIGWWIGKNHRSAIDLHNRYKTNIKLNGLAARLKTEINKIGNTEKFMSNVVATYCVEK